MLNSAFDLFVEHGYDSVTVEQIARNAGQSKGAYYWYFKDKEDCLRQILETQSAKLDLGLTKALSKGTNASARLLELSDFRNWGQREFVRFVVLLNGMAHSRTDSVRELCKKLTGQWSSQGYDLVRKLCREAAREAGWSEERIAKHDFDARVYCYLACYEGLFSLLLRGSIKPPPDAARLAETIHGVFIRPLLQVKEETPARRAQS